MNVDFFMDRRETYHFLPYEPGVKNGRKGVTFCGLTADDLDKRAWFRVGDSRGSVAFARACDTCTDHLRI